MGLRAAARGNTERKIGDPCARCESWKSAGRREVRAEGSGVVLQDCSNGSGTRGSRNDAALASSTQNCPFQAWAASFAIWSGQRKINDVEAEHATEGRLVTPNTSATLGTHVVASPASHGALEGGGLSVRSLVD